MIKLVADVLVEAGARVLLVRYTDTTKYDGEAGWFLPDDYLKRGEHPDEAARRILTDQLGIVGEPRLDHIESFGGEGDEAWHVVFHYRLAAPSAAAPRPSDVLAAARWFPLAELPARGSVAHDGWALDLIAKMTAAAR